MGSPVGVDEDRYRGEKERGCHEIVLGSSWLADYERVALQEHRGSNHRERPAPIRPTDAPSCQESNRQPAEVEEQRKRVAAGEQDSVRVQQLSVLRVEPIREDRLGVVRSRNRVAMRHFDRKRQVVPERIEVEDASIQSVLRGQSPVRKHKRHDPHRDSCHPPSRGWRGEGVAGHSGVLFFAPIAVSDGARRFRRKTQRSPGTPSPRQDPRAECDRYRQQKR